MAAQMSTGNDTTLSARILSLGVTLGAGRVCRCGAGPVCLDGVVVESRDAALPASPDRPSVAAWLDAAAGPVVSD